MKILVDDWGIAKVNRVNLQAAAAAALLLLPAEFSEVFHSTMHLALNESTIRRIWTYFSWHIGR